MKALADYVHSKGLKIGIYSRRTSRSHTVKMSATWKELGLSGPQPVRDLWLHKDLGTMNGEFTVVVTAHGTALVKIGRPRRQ